MNIVMLLGKARNMPTEVKQTANGHSVMSFSIETKKKSPDGTQLWSQFTRCVAWNLVAESIDGAVRDGDLIFIEGSLGTRTWTDKEGKKQYLTEVTVSRFEDGELLEGEETPSRAAENNPEDNWL